MSNGGSVDDLLDFSEFDDLLAEWDVSPPEKPKSKKSSSTKSKKKVRFKVDPELEEKWKYTSAEEFIAYGPGLESDSIKIKELNIFTVEHKERVTNPNYFLKQTNLEVFITGFFLGGQFQEEPLTLDNGDGSFDVEWEPPRYGKYMISIKIKRKSIPGSPFTVILEPRAKKNHPVLNETYTITPKDLSGKNLQIHSEQISIQYGLQSSHRVTANIWGRDGYFDVEWEPHPKSPYKIDINNTVFTVDVPEIKAIAATSVPSPQTKKEQERLSKLEQDLRIAEENLQNERKTRAQVQTELATTKTEIKTFRDSIIKLQKSFEDLELTSRLDKDRNSKTEEKLHASEKKVQELLQQIDTITNKTKRDSEQLQQLQKQLNVAGKTESNQLTELKKQLELAQDSGRIDKTQISKLSQELQATKKEIAAQRAKFKDLEDKLSLSESANTKLHEELSQLQKQLQTEREVSKRDRQRIVQKELELKSEKSKVEALTEQLSLVELKALPKIKDQVQQISENIASDKRSTRVSGSKTSASGHGLDSSKISVGENAVAPYFTIFPKDEDGNPISLSLDKLVVDVARAPKVEVEFLPNPDGTVGVKWKPKGYGEYSIDIKVEGQPIKGSPFMINLMSEKPTEKEEHPNPKPKGTPKSEPVKVSDPEPPSVLTRPKYIFDPETPIDKLIKVNAIDLLRAVQEVVKSVTDTNCGYETLVALAKQASTALRKLDTVCEEHPAVTRPTPKTQNQITVLTEDNDKLKEETLVIMNTVRLMLPDRFNDNNQKELATKITAVVTMIKKMVATSTTLQQLISAQ
eukprot:TRINITY_DN5453_c0_g1_i4.p1 TRINITY_DN5453_c0_g1~~TRINITY_DN5453_c0_g1_i4.p1  ORF type:complete len:804 (-),score=230.96 TRINITY_DN5453_c0_g1_i4:53-2464(-)